LFKGDDCAPRFQELRAAVAAFDTVADPTAGLPLQRLVAEFGLRSFQLLTEWALWAIERIDQTDVEKPADLDGPPRR
jgi:hypothetical protein